jgi:hypothetical protein
LGTRPGYSCFFELWADVGFRRFIVIGASALLAECVIAVAAAPSALIAGGTRVFDRTVVCTTRLGWVRVGGGPLGDGPYHPGILSVANSNGDTSPFAIVFALNGASGLAQRGAYLDSKRCSPSRTRVPLTRKGLPAPVPFGADAICPTGGRILVHLRYTYVPGAHNPKFPAGGRLVSASLAVRAYETLKPVAFGELTDGGRTLRFTNALGCT